MTKDLSNGDSVSSPPDGGNPPTVPAEPSGGAVVDAAGATWRHVHGPWRCDRSGLTLQWADLVAEYGPVTVPCLMAGATVTPACQRPATVEEIDGRYPPALAVNLWCVEHAVMRAHGELDAGRPITLRPIGGAR